MHLCFVILDTGSLMLILAQIESDMKFWKEPYQWVRCSSNVSGYFLLRPQPFDNQLRVLSIISMYARARDIFCRSA